MWVYTQGRWLANLDRALTVEVVPDDESPKEWPAYAVVAMFRISEAEYSPAFNAVLAEDLPLERALTVMEWLSECMVRGQPVADVCTFVNGLTELETSVGVDSKPNEVVT